MLRQTLGLSSLAAIAAVAASGLVAQTVDRTQPPRDTPAQQRLSAASASARIAGRVLTADGGRAVRRARVSINGGELPGGRAVLTDDAGAFDFPNLPAGRYTVTASRTGFVSISYGQRRPLQAGTPLQLAEGQELKGLELRLPRGSVISGHVFDETGEPMVGATVRLMMYRYAQGSRQLVQAGTGQTDDRGQYRIWGLNPGEYYVSAVGRNPNVGFPGPAGRGGRGGPAAALAARGIAPPDVEAALAARGMAAVGSAPDDPGEFAYAPTYYPGVASPGEARPVAVGLSAEVLNIDFSALLVRTARISGRVTGADGGPVGAGTITLAPEAAVGRGGPLGGGYGGRIQDGTFTISNVPPGRYTLRAMAGQGGGRGGRGRGGAPAEYATQPLSVDGDMDGLTVTLAPGATVMGAVTIQATQTPTLPDVTQFRITAPPADPSDFGPSGQARVNPDGTFILEGVAAGLRLIRAQGPRGWSLTSAVVDGREMIDTPLEVRSAQRITGVSLAFTDRIAEVNGTVADQQGTPLTEYTVLAFPTDAALWRPQSRHIMTTRPDQNGRFQLRGLPPGEYYLAAIDPEQQGEWFEPAFLDRQRPGATRFTLGDGDVRTQDVRVVLR